MGDEAKRAPERRTAGVGKKVKELKIKELRVKGSLEMDTEKAREAKTSSYMDKLKEDPDPPKVADAKTRGPLQIGSGVQCRSCCTTRRQLRSKPRNPARSRIRSSIQRRKRQQHPGRLTASRCGKMRTVHPMAQPGCYPRRPPLRRLGCSEPPPKQTSPQKRASGPCGTRRERPVQPKVMHSS